MVIRPRLGNAGKSVSERVQEMGYDRITDVREVREGEQRVGWEGTVWRWNNPACRVRR